MKLGLLLLQGGNLRLELNILLLLSCQVALELVLAARDWAQNLPSSVEAVVGDEAAHRAFLATYPSVRARDFPLLRLDVRDYETPFRCVRCS